MLYQKFDLSQFYYFRFFWGALFLLPVFYNVEVDFETVFIFCFLALFLESTLINTVIDPRILPNFPSSEAHSHFSELGSYQRPYSFGANSSVTSSLFVVMFSLISRSRRYIFILPLILSLIILSSGSGFFVFLVYLLFSRIQFLILLLFVFFVIYYTILLSLDESNFIFSVFYKISGEYVSGLYEFKLLQISEYFDFSLISKWIGIYDVENTLIGFGGDFGIASFVYQYGYVGVFIYLLFFFFTSKDTLLPYLLLLISTFHYPTLFFVPGQIIFAVIFSKRFKTVI
uniref:hypothetical protein n=1 Tax=Flavobacterium sp. TaxID=239 RepID=UPI004049DF82